MKSWNLSQSSWNPSDRLFCRITFVGATVTSTSAGSTWDGVQSSLPSQEQGAVVQPPAVVVRSQEPTSSVLVTWTQVPTASGSCHYWGLKDVCTYSSRDAGNCYWNLYIDVAPDGGVYAPEVETGPAPSVRRVSDYQVLPPSTSGEVAYEPSPAGAPPANEEANSFSDWVNQNWGDETETDSQGD